ncbi:MAG: glycerophosphodiester phosphodiesterase family protein [Planctomycetia bacterium]|nr:glycerophosphodiester phosphodiesterase family protein [Planctomycetia bacterium]
MKTFFCLLFLTLTVQAQEMLVLPNVAHRGHSAAAPENTLAAIRQAVKSGADGCEMDIYLSADGVAFLMHDHKLTRYTGEAIPCNSLSFAELRKRDVGTWKEEAFRGEKIPSFEEALLALKGTACRPVIEIKQPGAEDEVLKCLRRENMVETSVLIAFNAGICKKVRAAEPKLCVAWLCSKGKEESEADYIARIEKTLADIGTHAVDMEWHGVTPTLVDTLHSKGIAVWCWTVDGEKDMKALKAMGVDSITTNRPDVLKGLK